MPSGRAVERRTQCRASASSVTRRRDASPRCGGTPRARSRRRDGIGRHVRRRLRRLRRGTRGTGRAPERGDPERRRARSCCRREPGNRRSCPRASSPTRSCRRCGSAPALPTGSRGRCSPRSTRSSPTSGATWARARPVPSAGCSSCPTPGCAGVPTGTATGSPIRGTRTTPCTPPRATSPPRTGGPTSPARSSPTTMRSGTSTTCCSWPPCSAVSSPAPTPSSRSTGWRSRSSRRRSRWRR